VRHKSFGISATLLLVISAGLARSEDFIDSLACVPPLVDSPARCTFNIYGFVTDINGLPVSGVYVDDGGSTAISDFRGFYDLYQLQPGTVTLGYSYGNCGGNETVSSSIDSALLNGGKRHDIQLPCPRKEIP